MYRTYIHTYIYIFTKTTVCRLKLQSLWKSCLDHLEETQSSKETALTFVDGLKHIPESYYRVLRLGIPEVLTL